MYATLISGHWVFYWRFDIDEDADAVGERNHNCVEEHVEKAFFLCWKGGKSYDSLDDRYVWAKCNNTNKNAKWDEELEKRGKGMEKEVD